MSELAVEMFESLEKVPLTFRVGIGKEHVKRS